MRGCVKMAAKSEERRAIVIGGSIAGLFVGAFLRHIGWRVDIYERSSIELIGRGVGIFATPVYDFCSPSLVYGRVALVGDAGLDTASAHWFRRI